MVPLILVMVLVDCIFFMVTLGLVIWDGLLPPYAIYMSSRKEDSVFQIWLYSDYGSGNDLEGMSCIRTMLGLYGIYLYVATTIYMMTNISNYIVQRLSYGGISISLFGGLSSVDAGGGMNNMYYAFATL